MNRSTLFLVAILAIIVGGLSEKAPMPKPSRSNSRRPIPQYHPADDSMPDVSGTQHKATKKSGKATIVDPADCSSYPCLVFEDNFDTLDLDAWQHEITASGGGNWEFQIYTNNRSNSYVRGGNLYIKPTLTSDKYGSAFLTSGILDIWGGGPASSCTNPQWYGCFRQGNAVNIINPAQSARMRTVNSFSLKYGKIEVEAQMPRGDWLWPAIWMLPTNEFYGGWPSSGEIDLVESRGNLDLKTPSGEPRGHQHMGQTLHWGPFWPLNGYTLTTAERTQDFGTAFHRYGLVWDENGIDLLLDDNVVLHVDPGANGFWQYGRFNEYPGLQNPWVHGENKMSPFDKEFHLILNVAVGGTNGYFPDNWVNSPYPKPWNNQSPQAFLDFWNQRNLWYPTWNPTGNNGEDAAMKVNYVRAWKLKA